MNQQLIKIEYKNSQKQYLRGSQEELLELLIKGQPIEYEDVKSIWINNYAIKLINGEPYTWISEWEKENNNKGNEIVGNFIKMREVDIRNRVFCWFKGCIGALVFKGYLKVIPNFNFET